MRWRVEGVRWHPSVAGREPHDRARRDRRPRRTERLWKDDADQRHQRTLRGGPRAHRAGGSDAVGTPGARDRRARSLPHVSDPAALRALHRARERRAGRRLRGDAVLAARSARRASSRCISGRPMSLLEVRHVAVAYGDAPAVWDASLDVGDGELVAVIGPNGAGKTTLVNTIAGLQRARAGTLRFDGADLTG